MFSAYQIREIIKKNNLQIHKRLGQNFLIDRNVRDKIIAACAIKKEDLVLEIGPGLGALTESILPLSKRLIAIEKDKGLSFFLESNLADYGNLEIISEDILRYDIAALYKRRNSKIKVIGNLPFYITSPIIFHLLQNKRYIDSIFIGVQKEVAERIAATPGNKDYGLLSCSVQYHCQPVIKARISKGCFFPRPKVEASLVKMSIPEETAVKVKDEQLFFKVIRSAFNLRRKTLFNALIQSPILKIDKELAKRSFESLGLDLKIRGEALSLEEFARLSDSLTRPR